LKKIDMRTFLLDTCIWSDWINPNGKQHAHIKDHVKKLRANSKLAISIITWGEVFYGHKANPPKDPLIRADYIHFIQAKGPKIFDIDIHTAEEYGKLRAGLFDKYAPKIKRKASLRPEQLVDPASSKELGIQENDLWIAAQVIVLNLTLVTNDSLDHIQQVAGSDLHIENWLA